MVELENLTLKNGDDQISHYVGTHDRTPATDKYKTLDIYDDVTIRALGTHFHHKNLIYGVSLSGVSFFLYVTNSTNNDVVGVEVYSGNYEDLDSYSSEYKICTAFQNNYTAIRENNYEIYDNHWDSTTVNADFWLICYKDGRIIVERVLGDYVREADPDNPDAPAKIVYDFVIKEGYYDRVIIWNQETLPTEPRSQWYFDEEGNYMPKESWEVDSENKLDEALDQINEEYEENNKTCYIQSAHNIGDTVEVKIEPTKFRGSELFVKIANLDDRLSLKPKFKDRDDNNADHTFDNLEDTFCIAVGVVSYKQDLTTTYNDKKQDLYDLDRKSVGSDSEYLLYAADVDDILEEPWTDSDVTTRYTTIMRGFRATLPVVDGERESYKYLIEHANTEDNVLYVNCDKLSQRILGLLRSNGLSEVEVVDAIIESRNRPDKKLSY